MSDGNRAATSTPCSLGGIIVPRVLRKLLFYFLHVLFIAPFADRVE